MRRRRRHQEPSRPPLRVVLHAGLHKTGTTSFQSFCAMAHEEMRARGFHWPRSHDMIQHTLLWDRALAGDMDPILAEVEAARATGCSTLLVSSEDLEDAIVDPRLCGPLHTTLAEHGCTIEWIACVREPHGYFSSLYAELSRHGAVIDFVTAAETVAARGSLIVDAPARRWHFAFDHARLFATFRDATGVPLTALPRGSVDDVVPNEHLLRRLGADDALIEDVRRVGERLEVSPAMNARMDAEEVERRYVATFAGSDGLSDGAADELVAARLQRRRDHESHVRDLLVDRWPSAV